MTSKPISVNLSTLLTAVFSAHRVQQYEEAFQAISKLRADGCISATVYEMLWEGLEDKRAVDSQYQQALKKMLPEQKKSSS